MKKQNKKYKIKLLLDGVIVEEREDDILITIPINENWKIKL